MEVTSVNILCTLFLCLFFLILLNVRVSDLCYFRVSNHINVEKKYVYWILFLRNGKLVKVIPNKVETRYFSIEGPRKNRSNDNSNYLPGRMMKEQTEPKRVYKPIFHKIRGTLVSNIDITNRNIRSWSHHGPSILPKDL